MAHGGLTQRGPSTGTLKPRDSLSFYFEAVERAVDSVKARFPDKRIHLVSSGRDLRVKSQVINPSAELLRSSRSATP
jgi:hypothetical protein